MPDQSPDVPSIPVGTLVLVEWIEEPEDLVKTGQTIGWVSADGIYYLFVARSMYLPDKRVCDIIAIRKTTILLVRQLNPEGSLLFKHELIDEITPDLIRALVNEGLRAGKVPWCCDSTAENQAADILILQHDFQISDRETMEETCTRRNHQ